MKKHISLGLFLWVLIVLSGCQQAYITITFDYGYDDRMEVIQIPKNSKIDRPSDPSREGYTFSNWYETTTYQKLFSFDNIKSDSVTAYAKWDPVLLYNPRLTNIKLVESSLVFEGFDIEKVSLSFNDENYTAESLEFDLKPYRESLKMETQIVIKPIYQDIQGSEKIIYLQYVDVSRDIVFYETDFDSLAKGSYALGEVVDDGYTWELDEALIVKNASDNKLGEKAVRLREHGKMTLKEGIEQLESISFYVGTYGSDNNTTYEVQIKSDVKEYQTVFTGVANQTLAKITVTREDIETYFDTRQVLYFRIVKSSDQNKLNIDNMVIYTYQDAYYKFYENQSYIGYYEGIDDLKSEALFLKLRDIVSTGTKSVRYKDIKDILESADRDPKDASKVLTIYNRQSVSGRWDGSTWHREHVWPNSRLGVARVGESQVNQASDPHNLRAIIPNINSSRSNRYYENGASSLYQTVGSDAYYPGDDDKGDVARILLYMVVRYESLRLSKYVLNNEQNPNYQLEGAVMGNLELLLKWHQEDPVDAFEENRNDVIFSYQNNRNPFIDHPELFEEVYEYLVIQDYQQGKSMYQSVETVQLWIERKRVWL